MTATDTMINTEPTTFVGPYLDVDPKHLGFAIKAVLPHCGTAKELPAFHAVQFELTLLGELQLTATDRYTMGRSLVKRATSWAEEEVRQVLVELADVKRLAAWLPSVKLPTIPVVFTAAGLRFGYVDPDDSASSLTVGEFDVQYPKVEHLFAGPWDGEPWEWNSGSVMLNGDYLSRFATSKLARDKAEKEMGIRLAFTKEVRPVKVSFSDHFTGLIMAMRDPEA